MGYMRIQIHSGFELGKWHSFKILNVTIKFMPEDIYFVDTPLRFYKIFTLLFFFFWINKQLSQRLLQILLYK